MKAKPRTAKTEATAVISMAGAKGTLPADTPRLRNDIQALARTAQIKASFSANQAVRNLKRCALFASRATRAGTAAGPALRAEAGSRSGHA